MKFLYRSLFIIFIFQSINLLGGDSLQVIKRFNYKALPIVYYLPETSFAFGFAGVSTFKANASQKKYSLLQIAGIYTIRKQLLFTTTFDVFLKNDDYRLIGDFYYSRYFYNFYGVGRSSREEDFERYFTSYPSSKISFYRKINDKVKLGLLHQFQGISKIDYVENGTIEKLKPTGINGGFVSNIGVGALYEGRDNIISPSKGGLVEIQLFHSEKNLGAAYDYDKFNIDFRKYFTVNSVTFAMQAYASQIIGEAPFYDYNQIGSTSKMRGMSERRYRDKALMIYQSELRMPLYKRLRLNIFGALGHVGNDLGDIPIGDLAYSYGLGIRYVLNKTDKTMIRVDAARDREGFNFYFTTSEAF